MNAALLGVQVALNARRNQRHANFALMVYALQLRNARRRRRFWKKQWLGLDRRMRLGYYDQLMHELELEGEGDFRNLLRVEPAMFREILERIRPRITGATTNWRKPLDPGLKLALTMRHLATGEDYHSLRFQWRCAHNTISKVVREVCRAIVAEFSGEVVTCPQTPDGWKEVAAKFGDRWNFPHALGALDGKHIAIRKPQSSGSYYYNYKHFFSIILMALVDADYKFMWVDIGANGACSDSQVFNISELKTQIDDEMIGFPEPDPLPNDDKDMPYFMIGDDAFPLKTWMMKPFSRRNLTREETIFNYRLSRARRIVENAFGILANRFRAILGTMLQEPETVEDIVLACICLHNLMRIRYPAMQNPDIEHEDAEHQLVPGQWRDVANMNDMDQGLPVNPSKAAKNQRVYYKHWVNSPAGSVPWQDDMV